MSLTQSSVLLLVCLLSTAAPAAPATDRHGDPLPSGAVARLGTVRFRHGKPCSCAAFSSDGKMLASCGSDGTVRLWEVPSGKPLRQFTGHGKDVSAVAFSPDGKRLASGGSDSVLRIWDVATGKELFQIKRPQGDGLRLSGEGVSALAFSPDGKTLAGSNRDSWVCLWDAASGKELRRLLDKQQGGLPVLGTQSGHVAFSPDGKTLAAGCSIVRLWDVASGRKFQQFAGREYGGSFAFSPDGKTLGLTSSRFDEIRLVDVARGRVLHRLRGELSLAVGFSPDGKFVLGVGPQITLWEATTGKKARQFGIDIRHFGYWAAFSRDGKLLASGGIEGHTIALRSLPEGKLLNRLGEEAGAPSLVAFAPDGRTLAAAWEGRVYLWQPGGSKPRRLLADTDARVNCVTFSPDGKEVVLGGADGVVRGFEATTGKEVRRLIDCDEAVGCLAFSPDGKLLAAGSSDLTLHLWDASSGKMVRRHKGKAERERFGPPREPSFPSLAFSPDGKWLAAALQGPQPQVWETASGKEVRLAREDKGEKEEPRGSRATSIAFSPDSGTLAVGSSDGAIRLWEPATGKFRRRFGTKEKEGLPGGRLPFAEAWGGDGFTIAFSPDGRTLATWSNDRTPWYYSDGAGRTTSEVRLWEVSTGKERGTITGHIGGVTCVAFAPGGRSLVTGSEDTTLLLWDVVSLMRGGRPAKADLSAAELSALWADLASADSRKAFQAIGVLASTPGRAVPFLKEKLAPVVAPDARRLAKLIADLDAARFGVRQRASAELEKLGELAEESLRKAAKESASAEVKGRAGRLLEKLETERTSGPERLRHRRALEVLERTGTSEAQGVLSRLAQGAQGAWLTEEAKAAQRRAPPAKP